MSNQDQPRRRGGGRATTISSVALMLAGALLVAAPAVAQTGTSVSGRISDDTGAPLPGARIVIRELNVETSTDRQGRYVLPPLPPGEVTLEIAYLGMPSAVRTVTIEAGATDIGEIALNRANEGDVIVIVGSLTDGTARALNQQRTANNTTNVVSADSIGRFPDANIAEALQRIPGVGVERDQGEGNFISLRGAPSEFTSITIDGVSIPSSSPDTRAVDLGTLPSAVVSGLEISKSLLPHQEADSIAGSINLVTRSPFDNERFYVRADAGVGYNEFGSTNDERASFVVSNVFGDQGQFGALLSASWAQTDRRVDNIESVWDIVERPEGDEILGVPTQEFKDYETRRERISVTGALEFRPDDTNRYFLRGTFAQRTDDEFRNLLAIIYEDGQLQPGATETTATWNSGRFAREFRHRVLRDETTALSAGGEHRFQDFTVDYTVSAARSEQSYPNRQQLLFRSSVRPNLSYDFSADPNNPTMSLFTTQQHLNAANYAFREHVNRWADTEQDEIAAEANVQIPGTLWGNTVDWKFGARVRQRDVTSDEESYRNRDASAAPSSTFADLLSTEPSRNFGYNLGWKYNSGKVLDYFGTQRPITTAPAYRRIPNSTTTDYSVSEDIYAVYGMTEIDLDRATLIVGARVEHTEFEGSAPQFNEVSQTFTIGNVSRSYTDFFPNVTLRYEINDNLIARVAATRSIARPRYRDNVPRMSENSDSLGSVVNVDRGNPDLRPTLANNLDLGLEYYFESLGVVSAGLFYKDLEDYVFTMTTPGQFAGAPARITEVQNAKDGHIYGLELNYQQQFTFLPGWLSGFGASANFTLTDAEITLPSVVAGRGSSAPLPNQSERTLNLSVFYETEAFNARLAWTDRSDFIDEFNADARLDTYWEGREQLDFTASFDVNENVNLYFEAKNLTNSPGVRYAGTRARVTEREEFGYLLFGGVRVSF